jgi:hypothetical protein
MVKRELIIVSGQKLGRGQNLVFPALLTGPDQSINCYVSCDSIGESFGMLKIQYTDRIQRAACVAQL